MQERLQVHRISPSQYFISTRRGSRYLRKTVPPSWTQCLTRAKADAKYCGCAQPCSFTIPRRNAQRKHTCTSCATLWLYQATHSFTERRCRVNNPPSTTYTNETLDICLNLKRCDHPHGTTDYSRNVKGPTGTTIRSGSSFFKGQPLRLMTAMRINVLDAEIWILDSTQLNALWIRTLLQYGTRTRRLICTRATRPLGSRGEGRGGGVITCCSP